MIAWNYRIFLVANDDYIIREVFYAEDGTILGCTENAVEPWERSQNQQELRMGIKELLQNKREEILKIADQHGACNVRIFGSVARGEAQEDSDVDFLIDLGENLSPWFPVGLIQEWEALLGRKVDVVTAKSLHYFIRERVLQEAISL